LICLRKSVAPGRTNTRTFSHSGNTGRLPYHAQHGPKDSLLVTAQELDVSVASDSDESLADRSAMVAPVVDLHQDILLSVPRNRLVQCRSDSVLTPCSLHQSRLVLPLAFTPKPTGAIPLPIGAVVFVRCSSLPSRTS
jgi:hypothetical protein